MQIEFFKEDVELPKLDFNKIKDWLIASIEIEKHLIGDINFIYCSDEYLLKINKQYLKHDFYTDVITFDYCEELIVSGDVFMSTERILENSKLFSNSIEREFLRVIIHGVLHLLGYNDKTKIDKKEMTEMENFYLKLYDKTNDGV